jgi:integrase
MALRNTYAYKSFNAVQKAALHRTSTWCWQTALHPRVIGSLCDDEKTPQTKLVWQKLLLLTFHDRSEEWERFFAFRRLQMARNFPHTLQLSDGKTTVGYSFVERFGLYRVRFVNFEGNRVELATGCERVADAHMAAAKLINAAYQDCRPDLKRLGWDEVMAEVEHSCKDLRRGTVQSYSKCVKSLRLVLSQPPGKCPNSPADITQDHASRYSRLFLSGVFKRGKGNNAVTYQRSATTLSYYLRGLSALWGVLQELGHAKENPWKSLRKPQLEKKRKPTPNEEDVTAFFAWVHSRYPNWTRLHALLELKAVSGCRTFDLCQLRSNQLKNGRITWAAHQTKTKEDRSVLLPNDLFDTLKSGAGKTFLWEEWPTDLARFRPSRNKYSPEFQPRTVYFVVNNLFREYAEEHPDRPRLTPHSLRRRAITLTVLATQNVDQTAQAIGINPMTARAYYLDAKRAIDTDDVFRKVADLLRPNTSTDPTPSTDDSPPH